MHLMQMTTDAPTAAAVHDLLQTNEFQSRAVHFDPNRFTTARETQLTKQEHTAAGMDDTEHASDGDTDHELKEDGDADVAIAPESQHNRKRKTAEAIGDLQPTAAHTNGSSHKKLRTGESSADVVSLARADSDDPALKGKSLEEQRVLRLALLEERLRKQYRVMEEKEWVYACISLVDLVKSYHVYDV